MKIVYTADNHVQSTIPACRLDDFTQTQMRKLQFIDNIAKERNAIILNGGDITDSSNGKNTIGAIATNNILLKYYFESWGILGNHDLLNKSLKFTEESLISSLISINRFHHLTEPFTFPGTNVTIYPYNWGIELQHAEVNKDHFNIAISHQYVTEKEDIVMKHSDKGRVGHTLLDEFPEYDLILTGDNHKRFTSEKNGRILINPGSIFRLTDDQKDFEPGVFLIDTDTKEYELIKIPIEKGVITNVSLEEKKAKEERWAAFIEVVENPEGDDIDFEKEVEGILKVQKANKNTFLIANKAMSA